MNIRLAFSGPSPGTARVRERASWQRVQVRI
jgi:hypothetical protein